MEDKLKYATEREKNAYQLRHDGLTYKAIAEEMKICVSRANTLVKSAERRIREYDLYCENTKMQKEKETEIIKLEMSYGELKVISDILYKNIKSFDKQIPCNITFDRDVCKSKFPYEYFLMCTALQELVKTLKLPEFQYKIR